MLVCQSNAKYQLNKLVKWIKTSFANFAKLCIKITHFLTYKRSTVAFFGVQFKTQERMIQPTIFKTENWRWTTAKFSYFFVFPLAILRFCQIKLNWIDLNDTQCNVFYCTSTIMINKRWSCFQNCFYVDLANMQSINFAHKCGW